MSKPQKVKTSKRKNNKGSTEAEGRALEECATDFCEARKLLVDAARVFVAANAAMTAAFENENPDCGQGRIISAARDIVADAAAAAALHKAECRGYDVWEALEARLKADS